MALACPREVYEKRRGAGGALGRGYKLIDRSLAETSMHPPQSIWGHFLFLKRWLPRFLKSSTKLRDDDGFLWTVHQGHVDHQRGVHWPGLQRRTKRYRIFSSCSGSGNEMFNINSNDLLHGAEIRRWCQLVPVVKCDATTNQHETWIHWGFKWAFSVGQLLVASSNINEAFDASRGRVPAVRVCWWFMCTPQSPATHLPNVWFRSDVQYLFLFASKHN